MNETQAIDAMRNKTPVVNIQTAELGILERAWSDSPNANVLYLGTRLSRLTPLADLTAVDRLAADAGGIMHWLHGALPGQKGAEGK